MPLRAVLWDIGGPIDTEVQYEALIDAHIVSAFAARGRTVPAEEYSAANRLTVDSFAPNAYQAICYELAGGDDALAEACYAEVAARDQERDRARRGIEVRPGITALLDGLADAGLLLHVVANQPQRRLDELRTRGIGRWPASPPAGQFRKPDPRAFLAVCDALGVSPGDCVMVGDRIDNDIAPAKQLGMRTVRLRTGRHREQRPRTWLEVPDADDETVAGLREAIWRVLRR